MPDESVHGVKGPRGEPHSAHGPAASLDDAPADRDVELDPPSGAPYTCGTPSTSKDRDTLPIRTRDEVPSRFFTVTRLPSATSAAGPKTRHAPSRFFRHEAMVMVLLSALL